MQPVVFSAAWFDQHQRTLLWLLHAPVIGRWFRWVLCIRPHDVGYRRRIARIYPHAYEVNNRDGSRTLDCRTHAKYAKRLYYAFRPLWWALHAWDMAIANPLMPALNAGFDTLTAYPDPGDPGTTTCDGRANRGGVDEAFGTIRNGAGNETGVGDVTEQIVRLTASATSNQFSRMGRSIYGFNTSAIGTASIDAAVLSISFINLVNDFVATPDVHVCGVSPASNTTIAAADYGTVLRVSFASISVGSLASGYNDWTLSATGRAYINGGGVTTFSTQSNWDLDNSFTGTWASGADIRVNCYYADTTGTANDPKLVVTYTPQGRNRVTLDQNQASAVANFTNSASTSLAFSSAVTSGQLLTCCVTLGSSAATVSTITDSVNTAGKWQLATRIAPSAASSCGTEIWYAPNSSAGTPTVTVTLTSTAAGRFLFGLQSWTNASTVAADVLGTVTSTTGTSSNLTTPTMSSLSSGSVVVACWKRVSGATNRADPSGWSTIAPQNSTRENTFYWLQTDTTAISTKWQVTQSAAYAVSMAEFRGSTFTPSTVAATYSGGMPLLGVQ